MPRPPISVPAGTRFGRLVVVADRDGRDPEALVRCDCGSPPKLVPVSELRRRKNPLRSCGCGREDGRANLRFGTSMPGERNPSAKLTARKVCWIRRRLAAGERQRAIAERYGISLTQVRRIARGESWGHVR